MEFLGSPLHLNFPFYRGRWSHLSNRSLPLKAAPLFGLPLSGYRDVLHGDVGDLKASSKLLPALFCLVTYPLIQMVAKWRSIKEPCAIAHFYSDPRCWVLLRHSSNFQLAGNQDDLSGYLKIGGHMFVVGLLVCS